MFKFSSPVLLLFLYFPACCHAQNCIANNNAPATTPITQFTDNRDGSVTDTLTGLTWKKCLEGQIGNECSGTQTYTWQEALQRATVVNNGGGFAGKSDWRIPNIKELRSITEKQCTFPAVNLALFPINTNNSDFDVWSSSPIAGDRGDEAWVMRYSYGTSEWRQKTAKNYVRLVRGGN